ncbi:MAG: transpeptidase family protein [Bacteroidetes bacterium]|nr:transpeptidase family protein [Bacteroidota bacterium]
MSTTRKKSKAAAKPKVNTRRAILVRAYLVFGLALVFGVAVLVSAARLQLGSDKQFSEALKQKNTRVVDVRAVRGNIYADDGSLLATSIPRYDLVFDAWSDGIASMPGNIYKRRMDSLCLFMAAQFPDKTLETWKSYFANLRKNKVRYVVVRKDLGFDVVKRMKTWPLIDLGKFKGGFWYEEHGKRLYFMGDLARRTIGYIKDSVAIGLEGAFDSLLRGRDGKRMEQRMPGNTWRPVQVGNYKDPLNGYDIVTTLDVNLQDVAQNALNKVLADNEADHGCAVVMEVSTGAIKAMANLKRGKDGTYGETQNFAVDEFSEPGSTFKLLATLALLEDGLAKPTDSVDINWGEVKMFGETMKDAHKQPKRFFTLQESFEQSSNVGISRMVLKHYGKQPGKLVDHALRLGLNLKPEFDIRSSGQPRIKTPKSPDWSNTTLPWMSIGYETKVSPMQILMMYNAVANNGRMMKPYMVKEIRKEGLTISKIEPRVLDEKIAGEETIAALRKMMEGVVDHGTAKNLKSEDFLIAGKTGTAKISKGKKYEEGSYKASFVGYFPADKPQYTVIVVINEPRKGAYYGGLVAGPVFRDIAEKLYATSTAILPTLGTNPLPNAPYVLKGNLGMTKVVLNSLGISSQADSGQTGVTGWIEARKKEYSVALSPLSVSPKQVPDVRGMGLRDAIQLLENRRVAVTYDGYGRITQQSLPPGTALQDGLKIHLTLEPF